MKTIAFFNNKGGVGKTSLVYHLAWMYADLGLNVIAADLDPQANLTSMFLDDDRLEEIWAQDGHACTLYGAFQPLLEGTGDVTAPHLEDIAPGLRLVVGDLALSAAEDELSSQWPDCLDRKPRAFRVLSGLWRILMAAAENAGAELVLIDVGPNLGALNRAVLVAAQEVVIPLAPDLYSLQGLRNLGPTLRRWRSEWTERLHRLPVAISGLALPSGDMHPAGYVVLQHAVRLDRPVKAYSRWMARIPQEYRKSRPPGTGNNLPRILDSSNTAHRQTGESPTSIRSHFPPGILAPKPLSLRQSCSWAERRAGCCSGSRRTTTHCSSLRIQPWQWRMA
jgi:cellulose biosynthesis protein BcsQ